MYRACKLAHTGTDCKNDAKGLKQALNLKTILLVSKLRIRITAQFRRASRRRAQCAFKMYHVKNIFNDKVLKCIFTKLSTSPPPPTNFTVIIVFVTLAGGISEKW